MIANALVAIISSLTTRRKGRHLLPLMTMLAELLVMNALFLFLSARLSERENQGSRSPLSYSSIPQPGPALPAWPSKTHPFKAEGQHLGLVQLGPRRTHTQTLLQLTCQVARHGPTSPRLPPHGGPHPLQLGKAKDRFLRVTKQASHYTSHSFFPCPQLPSP